MLIRGVGGAKKEEPALKSHVAQAYSEIFPDNPAVRAENVLKTTMMCGYYGIGRMEDEMTFVQTH